MGGVLTLPFSLTRCTHCSKAFFPASAKSTAAQEPLGAQLHRVGDFRLPTGPPLRRKGSPATGSRQ
eukprot:9502382-Pyramimonas_sp.AAC.1